MDWFGLRKWNLMLWVELGYGLVSPPLVTCQKRQNKDAQQPYMSKSMSKSGNGLD